MDIQKSLRGNVGEEVILLDFEDRGSGGSAPDRGV